MKQKTLPIQMLNFKQKDFSFLKIVVIQTDFLSSVILFRFVLY